MVFEDEILIKDATGRFKILRGGKIYDLEEEVTPATAPTPPVSKIVKKIIEESKIEFEEPLRKRLEEIIEAYLKDVRDKFEIKSTLMQPKGVSGMSFSAEQADSIIKFIEKVKKAEAKEAKPIPKPVPPPTLPMEEKVSAKTPPSPKIPPAGLMAPGVAEFVFSPADEQEIMAYKQKLPSLVAGLKPIEIAKFVHEIVKESGIVLGEVERKKLENIILTHLKDVRDGFETRETLLRAAEPTGAMLTLDQTEKILKIASKKLQELESGLKERAEEEIKKAVSTEKEKEKEKWQEAETKVREKINERWAEITGKPAGSEPVKVGPELLAPPLALRPKTPQPPAAVPPSIVKTAEETPLAPPPAVSKVLPSSPTPPPVFSRPELPKTKPVLPKAPLSGEAAPVAPPPKELKPLEILKPVTPVFRRPETPSKRPRIEDVKVRPRLVGPVEEIKEMTLVDFRQLARDPREAMRKILDKLNLLEKESFAKRIAGIRAWQQSAVNKIYLEIVRQIVSEGKSFSEIIQQRTAEGKPVLEEEEFKAIMELNRVLRY
jgi:hypothetical protein